MIKKPHAQLFGAPVGVFLPQFSQIRDDIWRDSPGMRMRRAGAVKKGDGVRWVETFEPLIAGFTADAEATAKG